jgi:predicted RNase H-like HicB family nuclease
LNSQTFLTVIESGPESFGAFAPDIQGCIAFSKSREEVSQLFKLGAESHLRELANTGEVLPLPTMTEIPGLSVGVQSGTITLEWTIVEFPALMSTATGEVWNV